MIINQADHIADNRRRQGLMAAGGLLGALAASSCCILPLVLFGLGSAEHGSGISPGLPPISRASSPRRSRSSGTPIGWFTDRQRAPAPMVRPARARYRIASSKQASSSQRSS